MLPPVPSVGISVNIYPFWLPPNSILLRSGPCEFLLERIPDILSGANHIHVTATWPRVKCQVPHSLSLYLVTLSVFQQLFKNSHYFEFSTECMKVLQENSELENFPQIFRHCFDPPRRKQPMDSLVTSDSPDLFHALLQCGDFYLRIMNSKGHYFHCFGQDSPYP